MSALYYKGENINTAPITPIVSITQAEYDSNKTYYDNLDSIIEIKDSTKNGGDASNVKYKATDVASELDKINTFTNGTITLNSSYSADLSYSTSKIGHLADIQFTLVFPSAGQIPTTDVIATTSIKPRRNTIISGMLYGGNSSTDTDWQPFTVGINTDGTIKNTHSSAKYIKRIFVSGMYFTD